MFPLLVLPWFSRTANVVNPSRREVILISARGRQYQVLLPLRQGIFIS